MRTSRKVYVLISILPLLCTATLTPKSKRTVKVEKIKSGPQNYTVFDRNLVSEDVTAKDVLLNHQAYFANTEKHNFNGLVLAYVTPWNDHGYDIAKIFANKFTHISPVWLQLKRDGELLYTLTGTHDVDSKWMQKVKKLGAKRGVKIVPRILFESWTADDWFSMFNNSQEQTSLAKTLIDVCKQYHFDGVVIEIWLRFHQSVRSTRLVTFVQKLGTALKESNFELFLVVPPKREGAVDFDSSHYGKLYDYVTGFSLMTYDFSNIQRPGPNAPYEWMEKNVLNIAPKPEKRDKILLGLNFYGMEYTPNGGGPIVGHDFVKKIQDVKSNFAFDASSGEHFIETSEEDGRHLIFYPTLESIQRRLRLAEGLGTGLSIWEIGQGLDYFYDLL